MKLSIIAIILLLTGFEIGYLSHSLIQTTININAGNYSFDIGDKLNHTLNKALDKCVIYKFQCSTMWYDFGLRCNGTKFVNASGMYCDNKIICENERVKSWT